VSGCRAEIHDVLEEYKEGAAKFIGKVCVCVCLCVWRDGRGASHWCVFRQYSRQKDVGIGFPPLGVFSLIVALRKT